MRLKRMAAALMIALVLAGVAHKAMEISASPCAWLTPDDWFLYWLYGCQKDAAGGGGSGAGQS